MTNIIDAPVRSRTVWTHIRPRAHFQIGGFLNTPQLGFPTLWQSVRQYSSSV